MPGPLHVKSATPRCGVGLGPRPGPRSNESQTRAHAPNVTFFIGACVYAFNGVFRQWSRERRERLAPLGYGLSAEDAATRVASGLFVDDLAEAVALRDTVRRILEQLTPEARLICGLVLQGQTCADR